MANALPILFVIAGGLCLSLVLLALWQSLRGLVIRGAGAGSTPVAESRARLLHEKQELLTAIRDVRLEHELGKVSDADFSRLEQDYRARAREVLHQLEEQLSPHRGTAKQLLSRALGRALSGNAAESDGVVAGGASAEVSVVGACPRCESRNDADAVFCKKCGERLFSEVRP